MRGLGFCLLMVFLAGCATVDRPRPLTSGDIIVLAKSGSNPQQIIEELKRTDTVIPLSATEIVRLHDAGVPNQVLDYLQHAQIDEIRWRDRWSQMYWYGYGPLYRGVGPCPWLYPPGLRRPYYGASWGC